MKINQVEELVGITKKNIRFYEDQGLVEPDRNPENGYRDYSLKDVERLRKIKLLRMVDVSCEDIRRLIQGSLSLKECMESNSVRLTHKQRDIGHMKDMCEQIASENAKFEDMNAGEYLEHMKEQEKGGVQFMDVKKSDVKVRRTGAVLAAIAGILVMMGWMSAGVVGFFTEDMPVGALIFMVLFPAIVIISIIYVLVQRMKELKGGELDEAGKY